MLGVISLGLDHRLAGRGRWPLNRGAVFRRGNLRNSLLYFEAHWLPMATILLCGCRRLRRRRRSFGCIRAAPQRPAPCFFFSMRQFPQPLRSQTGARPGSSRGTISLGIRPPPALGGVPELALQLFRSSEQAAPEEFLRRGLDFSFHFFRYRCFFFDFLDDLSPPLCFFVIL